MTSLLLVRALLEPGSREDGAEEERREEEGDEKWAHESPSDSPVGIMPSAVASGVMFRKTRANPPTRICA
jgi:hypothetical protein